MCSIFIEISAETHLGVRIEVYHSKLIGYGSKKSIQPQNGLFTTQNKTHVSKLSTPQTMDDWMTKQKNNFCRSIPKPKLSADVWCAPHWACYLVLHMQNAAMDWSCRRHCLCQKKAAVKITPKTVDEGFWRKNGGFSLGFLWVSRVLDSDKVLKDASWSELNLAEWRIRSWPNGKLGSLRTKRTMASQRLVGWGSWNNIGGFHSHGESPIAGWFIMENPSRNGWWTGVSLPCETSIWQMCILDSLN